MKASHPASGLSVTIKRFVRRESYGFTLLEMMAACVILATLASIFFVVLSKNLNRFEAPTCMANLRNLHLSLSTYVQDKGQWPQLPEDMDMGTYAEHGWWMETLKDYGMEEKSWRCPTIARLTRSGRLNEADTPKINYLPSLFDDHPSTPFRWKNMPWAMEAGNMHGSGILMIYSDGSIRNFNDVFEAALRAGIPIQR